MKPGYVNGKKYIPVLHEGVNPKKCDLCVASSNDLDGTMICISLPECAEWDEHGVPTRTCHFVADGAGVIAPGAPLGATETPPASTEAIALLERCIPILDLNSSAIGYALMHDIEAFLGTTLGRPTPSWFNTGREHTPNGQRIAWIYLEQILYFVDIDRCIDGVIDMKFKPRQVQIMTEYDAGNYRYPTSDEYPHLQELRAWAKEEFPSGNL